MIDGFTAESTIDNFDLWKSRVNLAFDTLTDIDTGRIATIERAGKKIIKYTGEREGYRLIVKEVLDIHSGQTLFYLTIRGSLHTSYYKGKNYQPFKYDQLQCEIANVCNSFSLDPTQTKLSNLEIGLNLVTPFPVTPFLMQNVICYKGRPLNRYDPDSNGISIGIYVQFSQYQIKIYDKGGQNRLPYNLMRFEKRFNKMQSLNNLGIQFLSDLQTRSKVEGLLTLLLKAWQHVLIYDIDQHLPSLKARDLELLTNGKNPKFWEQLRIENSAQYKYQRIKFRRLVEQFGRNYHQLVKDLIQMEWKELCKNGV